MRPVTLPPPDVIFGVSFLPGDFSERLEHFKGASGLTWDAMAACMGVDPRQLRRWRYGTRPSGERVVRPAHAGGPVRRRRHMLLGVNVLLPEPDALEALAEGAGFREAVLPGKAGRSRDVGVQRQVYRPVHSTFPRTSLSGLCDSRRRAG